MDGSLDRLSGVPLNGQGFNGTPRGGSDIENAQSLNAKPDVLAQCSSDHSMDQGSVAPSQTDNECLQSLHCGDIGLTLSHAIQQKTLSFEADLNTNNSDVASVIHKTPLQGEADVMEATSTSEEVLRGAGDSLRPAEEKEDGKKEVERDGRQLTEDREVTMVEGMGGEEVGQVMDGDVKEVVDKEAGNGKEVESSVEKEEKIVVEVGNVEEKHQVDGGMAGVVSECKNQTPQDQDLGLITEEASMRYTLSDDLHLVAEARKDFNNSNYFRGCKWAPDGSCLLACNDDNKMRLYNLPAKLYSSYRTDTQCDLLELSPALTVTARECIYDYCWYPRMDSWEPQTCCFLSTCKDHPVHLWDAFTGQNRASYVPYNHLDEVVSSYSLSFSLDGERIFAGFHKGLRIFNLTRPGRECRTLSTYAKKSGGQSGIISSIAQCPTTNRVYALGAYSCSVGVYSEDMKEPCMILTSLASGVTHLAFSPDGHTLYSGFRKCGSIMGWDLRNPGRILHSMERVVDTNQRIYFDMTSDGDHVVSGSTCGHIFGWKKTSPTTEGESRTNDSLSESLEPAVHHLAHSDAVNGVSVHPRLPLLASCSGQRHYPLPGHYSDDEEMEGNDTTSDFTESSSRNSLRLWSYG